MGGRIGVLAVVAVVAVAAASASAAPPAPVSSGDPLASCTAGRGAGGAGFDYPASEVEPFVAVDPASPGRLVAVWQQDRWSNGGARGEVSAYSTDGGASWKPVVVPFGTCADPGSPFSRVSDPWVAIGPDGIAYAAAIAYGRTATGVLVSASHDGGQSWSRPRVALRQKSATWFEDKDSIAADPTRPGTAYVTWTRDPLTPRPPAMTFLSITRNGGRTWSKARAIVNPGDWGTTTGNVIAVDPRDGALADVFELQVERTVVRRHCTLRKASHSRRKQRVCTRRRVAPRHPSYTNSLEVARSRNGGATWSHPRRIARVVTAGFAGRGGPLRTGGALPAVAVDPAGGRLYVAWADGRFTGRASLEIAVSASDDDGSTWSRPVRASSSAAFAAFDPAIAVASDGAVAVTYDDLRTWDRRDAGHVPAEVWATVSHDGAASFGGERLLAGPFDMATAPGFGEPGDPEGGYFVGDYQGLAAMGAAFTAVFATTTAAGSANPTDLVAASFPP